MQKMGIISALLVLLMSPAVFGQGHGNPAPTSPTPSCESTDPSVKIDIDCLEQQLTTTGLGGWVHASVDDQMLLVFTWRRPGNFFVNVQLPFVSKDPKILGELIKLRRHDQIEIKGEFLKNDAPIKHINVTELKVVKAYDGPVEEFEYNPTLPKSILSGNILIGKVHIVANGGAVLVVEVGDRVYPVFNEKPEVVASLFRNDKIELNYRVQFSPTRPPHLVVDYDMATPVRVIEEIEKGHGEPIELTGPLVMFPESPQIKFNVFALRTEDADNVSRNYTIVNFSDIDLFFAIRDKLQKIWDQNLLTMQYDRNKYINRSVILTVKGTKNVVAADQANPQVVPVKIDDVQIMIQ